MIFNFFNFYCYLTLIIDGDMIKILNLLIFLYTKYKANGKLKILVCFSKKKITKNNANHANIIDV